jgi:hypothetical protein
MGDNAYDLSIGRAHGLQWEQLSLSHDNERPCVSLASYQLFNTADGAIIHQALEEPDLKMTELTRLRANYARVTSAFMSGEAETHRHGI